ncbi:hypothetical protein SCP_0802850 [Sparassis crispa]|uniref:FZ domain-containing protein n=1 Tax=Sparassis crispa TaxID=139825 RepID=A0A401GUA0_9APHY|nr:hypothetical protein SCP_0802850 [Sparassis crispa]GBE85763.1 hypothetical protein SCP_0802850 [Sparassis crispa]
MRSYMRLPRTLLCLLQAFLVVAQPPQLTLNHGVYNFSSSTLPNPPTFKLPVSNPLYLSVALCSAQTTLPRLFVTNDSTASQPGPAELGQANVYEIPLEDGLGVWSGPMNVQGVLAIYNASQSLSFEIGLSNAGPIHQILDELPLLGDTTSNQVLLFSPPFSPPEISAPTYPNYTLPAANLTFPPAPPSPSNYSVFVTLTSTTPLPLTTCALNVAQVEGSLYDSPSSVSSQGLWLRDTDGWRWQWLINGLLPQKNYTAYAILNDTKVSGPINFVTKSASFSCPLVHSLPFCPAVAYAAPLPDLTNNPALGATAGDLPDSLTGPLLSGLANFTVMLTTLACGRDKYSQLVTCADCQTAYRAWLCMVSFPRCGEYPSSTGTSTQPALQPVAPSATPRNPSLAPFAESYDAMLPCLETCNAVDRACPPFLGFRCPVPQFTAGDSYGVGFIDSGAQGVMGGGSTGAAADRWGNVWCNMP